MTTRKPKKKKPADLNQLAATIVKEVTNQSGSKHHTVEPQTKIKSSRSQSSSSKSKKH